MTLKVWAKLIIALALVTLPLIVSNHILQRQSLDLLNRVHGSGGVAPILDDHLNLLKETARREPSRTAQLHSKFQKTLDAKIALDDLSTVQGSIAKEITSQSLKITLTVLAIALFLSLFLSKNIVATFSWLHRQNQVQASRLQTLSAIESWQKLARMLVHELRAPLTPLKLVAGDLDEKYRTLPPKQFESYLQEGSQLMSEQIASVEAMVESFLKFAKLPEVTKRPTHLREFLEQFADRYRDHSANLSLTVAAVDETVSLDPELCTHLIFNLMRNALEANGERPLTFTVTADQTSSLCHITIANNGRPIPEDICARIFDPYVTSSGPTNLGLGLTICKKIALDHGGDLWLKSNDEVHGIAFQFDLPKGETREA
ncbi:MAG: hypothetical protein HYR96_05870 [Deltaproteobacteria bacterium]|nr:hypothetical protein [Deltaproteobacteria bacterium]MBI3295789.1 hypothetical protein [Deltaproteobacteria bacterium]